MTPDQVLNELKSKISIGIDLETAMKIFVEHYDSTKVGTCSKADEEDMLLFQWGGPYSWDDSFSINLTRQFSFNDDQGDYIGMKQLRMDCKYSPKDIQIDSGNFWFEGKEINEFLDKIFESNAFEKTKNLDMTHVEFNLNEV